MIGCIYEMTKKAKKYIGDGLLLHNYVENSDLTQEDFAKMMGFSFQNLHLYFNQEHFSPRFKQKLLDKNIDIFRSQKRTIKKPLNLGVPIYDIEATAGDLQFNGDMPETIQGHITLPNFRECVAFVYVRGDSMYSILKAGDLIGLIPVTDMDFIQYGNIYLIVTHDNQRMVKFIRKAEQEDHIILRSKNKEYDDILLKTDKIRKLFRVKGPIRDDWQ